MLETMGEFFSKRAVGYGEHQLNAIGCELTVQERGEHRLRTESDPEFFRNQLRKRLF